VLGGNISTWVIELVRNALFRTFARGFEMIIEKCLRRIPALIVWKMKPDEVASLIRLKENPVSVSHISSPHYCRIACEGMEKV